MILWRSRIPFPIVTLLARATNIGHQAGTHLGSENVSFQYLYCDAGNYKLRGTAIFTNHSFLTIEEIEQQIRSFLKDGEFFIARQLDMEERFLVLIVWVIKIQQIKLAMSPLCFTGKWNVR